MYPSCIIDASDDVSRSIGVFRQRKLHQEEVDSWLDSHPGIAFLANIAWEQQSVAIAVYWLETVCPRCGNQIQVRRDQWSTLDGNLESLFFNSDKEKDCVFVDLSISRLLKSSMTDNEYRRHYGLKTSLDCSRLQIIFEGRPSNLREQPIDSLFEVKASENQALNYEDYGIISEMQQIRCQAISGYDDENTLILNGYIAGKLECPQCGSCIQVIAGHEKLNRRIESDDYRKTKSESALWPQNPITGSRMDALTVISFDFQGEHHRCGFQLDTGEVELDGMTLFRNPQTDQAIFDACSFMYAAKDNYLFGDDCGVLIGNYLESLLSKPSFFDDEEMYAQLKEDLEFLLVHAPSFKPEGSNFLNLILHHRFRRYPDGFYERLLQPESLPVYCDCELDQDGDNLTLCTLFECSILPRNYEDLALYYDTIGLPLHGLVKQSLCNDPIKMVKITHYSDLPFEDEEILAQFLSLPNCENLLQSYATRGISFAPLRFIGRAKREDNLLRYIKDGSLTHTDIFTELSIAPFQRGLDDPESVPVELEEYLNSITVDRAIRSLPLIEYWLERGTESLSEPFRYTDQQKLLERVVDGVSYELVRNPIELYETSKILEEKIDRLINLIPEHAQVALKKVDNVISGAEVVDRLTTRQLDLRG